MSFKEEREKAGLKLNIQKTKSMASSPITSWQIDGETMEHLMQLNIKQANNPIKKKNGRSK